MKQKEASVGTEGGIKREDGSKKEREKQRTLGESQQEAPGVSAGEMRQASGTKKSENKGTFCETLPSFCQI